VSCMLSSSLVADPDVYFWELVNPLGLGTRFLGCWGLCFLDCCCFLPHNTINPVLRLLEVLHQRPSAEHWS
jgi:hypothetical protein